MQSITMRRRRRRTFTIALIRLKEVLLILCLVISRAGVAAAAAAAVAKGGEDDDDDDDAIVQHYGNSNQDKQQRQQQQQLLRFEDDDDDESNIISRALAKKDPTDAYFCGRGFADAAESCEYPCPTGSLEDCPSGMLCYYNTPCSRIQLLGPTKRPVDPTLWRPPTQAPWAEGDPRLGNYCGNDWSHADDACSTWCPEGDAVENACPYGQSCFTDTSCPVKLANKPSTGLWYPPTQAPWAEDDRRLTFFCGTSWGQAGEACGKWCPDADDTKCPYGQSCFSDTTCKYSKPPTEKPTTLQPSLSPTSRPTGPTRSPTLSPVESLSEDPSNNRFCGNDWQQAATTCSLENHCGKDGKCSRVHEACWHDVLCDVRDFISAEEGGWLGRPSHEEIAKKMGLKWPSDDPTDRYFCGLTITHASKRCARPCPNKSPLSCKHGESCHENTQCDIRVTPGYGITKTPTMRPTKAKLPYEDRENYSFCGLDWRDASNKCNKRYCGDGSACPEDQSCFGDTECNIQDRLPPPPSFSPTRAPVPYDHKSNSFFCGASYTEAAEYCSFETHCNGLHSECGTGRYCWSGVTCNIQDFTVPTPKRTAEPTIFIPPTTNPTKSPSDHSDPRNSRFCGISWSDASLCPQKHDGRPARWCPRGSNEECPDGETCWADTMCNIMEFTLPPSLEPTDPPTDPQTWSPTETPIKYKDPMNTNFCGSSYMDAQENCSIRTHCPAGLSTECPLGDYCWTVGKLGCNIVDLVYEASLPDPTQMPTASPSREFEPTVSPSMTPLTPPSKNPTDEPTTGSTFEETDEMIEETDERNSFYCGISPTISICQVQCPDMTGCPPGETCYRLPECSSMFSETRTNSPLSLDPTKSPETPYPTPYPTATETEQPTSRPNPTPTLRPTNKPTSNSIPIATILNPPTFSPTMTPKAEPKIAYFPFTETALPKPPTQNAQRIQHIVQSIQLSLENNIFVVELRSGAQIQSSLYTFNGFLESLKFYTQLGVNGRYLYLGQENSRSGIESLDDGIANLALFLAKMMDTISHERCDPNKISCGMPAFDSIFEEQTLRVECSPLSSEAGMNCPAENGCVCILGILNNELTQGKYSEVDFCESNLLQSICSRRIEHGEELRWIAAMSHWIFFVQQYDEGWNYLDELHNFVRGGMVDVSFVSTVAGLSVLDSQATEYTDPSVQKFEENFFKAMMKLSEGMTQPNYEQAEIIPAQPSANPVQSFVQTSGPTTTPPSIEGTEAPTSRKKTDKPVVSTKPPTFSALDLVFGPVDGDPPSPLSSGDAVVAEVSEPPSFSSPASSGDDITAESSKLSGLASGHSSLSPVSAGATGTGENSQSPVFSADSSLSPMPAGVAKASEEGKLPVLSAAVHGSVSPVFVEHAASADNHNPTVYSAGASFPSVTSAESDKMAESSKPPVLSAGYNSPPPMSAKDAWEAKSDKPTALYPSSNSADSSSSVIPSPMSAEDAWEAKYAWPPAPYPSSYNAGLSSSAIPSPIPRQKHEYEDVPWYRGYTTGHSRGNQSCISDFIRIIMFLITIIYSFVF